MFPSPCRILKALCCRCLKKLGVQTCWAAAAGTVQIMVGVLNIGLGLGRTNTRLGDFTSLGAAYWLGAVFIVSGIMTVLAGRFPSSCLVGFTVFLNIVGAIFSITGIVLYAIDLSNSSLLWVCDRPGSDPNRYDDSCRNVAALDQNLVTSLDRTLILLAVLLLVISISFAALGIGFLTGEMKEEEVDNVSKEDLKEILLISPETIDTSAGSAAKQSRPQCHK